MKILQINLKHEQFREYDLLNGQVYRIEEPQILYLEEGCDTHRVSDEQQVLHTIKLPTHYAIRSEFKCAAEILPSPYC